MSFTPRLRVGWYAVTDTVVIQDTVEGDEVEVSREQWLAFVADVKAGRLDEPWNPPEERP